MAHGVEDPPAGGDGLGAGLAVARVAAPAADGRAVMDPDPGPGPSHASESMYGTVYSTSPALSEFWLMAMKYSGAVSRKAIPGTSA